MLSAERLPVLTLALLVLAAGSTHALSLGPGAPTTAPADQGGVRMVEVPASGALAELVAAAHHAEAARGLLAARTALPAASTPSVAIFGYLAGHGYVPTPAERTAVLALDGLGPEVAPALAATVDAFARLERVAAASFQGGHIDAVAVVTARADLLDAFARLDGALGHGLPMAAPPPIIFGEHLAFDLDGQDTWWFHDVRLLIDVGGNDTYLNNGGGTDIGMGPCEPPAEDGPARAAALLDLSGNDRYLRARGCGANGGAIGGVALLVDGGGDDLYFSGCCATNGGAWYGVAMLLDGGGNDRYEGGTTAVNGGVFGVGAALLLDQSGDDVYIADRAGVNGGTSGRGPGLLLDLGGTDTYSEYDPAASGTDVTLVPKGTAGAQIDSEGAPAGAS